MKINLIRRVEWIFSQKLNAKTGWGRNEIKKIFKESVNQAFLEIWDNE
jgi:hypothetical protein